MRVLSFILTWKGSVSEILLSTRVTVIPLLASIEKFQFLLPYLTVIANSF